MLIHHGERSRIAKSESFAIWNFIGRPGSAKCRKGASIEIRCGAEGRLHVARGRRGLARRSKPQLRTARRSGRQRILLVANHGKGARTLGVDRDPMPLIVRKVEDLVDRMHRAGRDAGTAVDADLGIDEGLLTVGMKAGDGADRHAVGEAAKTTVARYDVRHVGSPAHCGKPARAVSEGQRLRQTRATSTRLSEYVPA